MIELRIILRIHSQSISPRVTRSGPNGGRGVYLSAQKADEVSATHRQGGFQTYFSNSLRNHFNLGHDENIMPSQNVKESLLDDMTDGNPDDPLTWDQDNESFSDYVERLREKAAKWVDSPEVELSQATVGDIADEVVARSRQR